MSADHLSRLSPESLIERSDACHRRRIAQPYKDPSAVQLTSFAARQSGLLRTIDRRCNGACRQPCLPGQIAGRNVAHPVNIVQAFQVCDRYAGDVGYGLMKQNAAGAQFPADFKANCPFQFFSFAGYSHFCFSVSRRRRRRGWRSSARKGRHFRHGPGVCRWRWSIRRRRIRMHARSSFVMLAYFSPLCGL
jgi:hypothetical protein